MKAGGKFVFKRRFIETSAQYTRLLLIILLLKLIHTFLEGLYGHLFFVNFLLLILCVNI